MIEPEFAGDVAAIVARRHDNGADFWASPDGRLARGGPFSTLEAVVLLRELGVEPGDPVLAGATSLIWAAWRPDGRFRLAPSGAIYPCQTAQAACTLAQLGLAADPRLAVTFEHLRRIQYRDGGWRCNKFSFGRGPETEFSNPGPTLTVLDAFRFATGPDPGALDRAVEFLLGHWVSRVPLGPCHYGIGSLFGQVGYPFADYNLFRWVYVLSHYQRARADARFVEALTVLEGKLSGGQVVPERVHRALAGLEFCAKGRPSVLATRRHAEIRRNLAEPPA